MARTLGKLVISIGASTSLFERELSRAGKSIDVFAGKATKSIDRTVSRVDNQLNKMARSIDRGFRGIGGTINNLVNDIQIIGPALKIAGTALGAFSAGFAAVVGAGKIFSVMTERLDTFAKTADRIGTSTEFLSGLTFAAGQSGIAIETLNDNLRQFNTNLFRAGENSSFAAQLNAMGLSIEQLIRLSPDERIRTIAQRISEIEDSSTRASAAVNLFGESGRDLVTLFAGGAGGLDDFVSQAERLGAAFSREELARVEAARDAIAEIGLVIESVSARFLIAFAPIFETLADFWTQSGLTANGVQEIMDRLAEGVAFAIHTIDATIAGGFMVWFRFRSVVQQVTSNILEMVSSLVDGVETLMENLAQVILNVAQRVQNIVLGMVNTVISQIQVVANLASQLPGINVNAPGQFATGGRGSLVGLTGNSGTSTGPHLDIRYARSFDPQRRRPTNEHLNRFTVGGTPLTQLPITSEHGPRVHPVTGRRSFHAGVDFGTGVGQEIRTTVPIAKVSDPWFDRGGGGWVTTVTFQDGVALNLLHQDPSVRGRTLGGGTQPSAPNVNLGSGALSSAASRLAQQAQVSLAQSQAVGPDFATQFFMNRDRAGGATTAFDPSEVARVVSESSSGTSRAGGTGRGRSGRAGRSGKTAAEREAERLAREQERLARERERAIERAIQSATRWSEALERNLESVEMSNEVERFRLELMEQGASGIDRQVEQFRELNEVNAEFMEAKTAIEELAKQELITQEQQTNFIEQLTEDYERLNAAIEQSTAIQQEQEQLSRFTEMTDNLSRSLEDLMITEEMLLERRLEMTEVEQLMLELKRMDVELTDAQTEALIRQAEAIDAAAERIEFIRGQYELMEQTSGVLQDATIGLFSDLITGSRSAGEAFERFFDQIFNNLLRLALNTLFSSIFGGSGGLIGSILGFQKGGVVPETGTYMLHAGERVLTPTEARRQAAGGGGNITINNNAGVQVQARRSGMDTEIVINEAVSRARQAVENDFVRSTGSGYGAYASSIQRGYQVNRRL